MDSSVEFSSVSRCALGFRRRIHTRLLRSAILNSDRWVTLDLYVVNCHVSSTYEVAKEGADRGGVNM